MKTKEQLTSIAEAYLNKANKHLFVTNDGYFFKVETIERDGNKYYVTIYMSPEKVIIRTDEILSDGRYKLFGNNSVSYMKSTIFTPWNKKKSIPYFKKMKEFVSEIMKDVSLDNKVNQSLTYNYTSQMSEMALKQ